MRCLLYIETDGRVAVGDVDTGARFAFDAMPTSGSARLGVRATTAAWSSGGQWTAWSIEADELGDPHEIRVHHEGDQRNLIVAPTDAFYLYPSPCGRYLSHLSPGPLGLELAVTDVRGRSLTVMERGQPLFWAWSPDGGRLAVHVDGRVLIATPDGAGRELTDDTAGFIAPAWMADGSVVLAGPTHLERHAPDGEVSRLCGHPGTARFALDPDGRRVALIDEDDTTGRPTLVVVDLLTGQRDVVLRDRPLAFNWSPDGRRLAVLAPAGPGRVQWRVSDGEQVVRLASFRPGHTWVRTVLPFFEQYAHSHAVWSADGTQLVAVALHADGTTGAVVHHVGEPERVERFDHAPLAWWAD